MRLLIVNPGTPRSVIRGAGRWWARIVKTRFDGLSAYATSYPKSVWPFPQPIRSGDVIVYENGEAERVVY